MNPSHPPQKHKLERTMRQPTFAKVLFRAAAAVGLVGIVSPLFASVASFTFTAPNPGWVAAKIGGSFLSDPQGDTTGSRDIVGDQTYPLLYVGADATHLYYRLRVDSTPLQSGTNFKPFGWGCVVNTDSNSQTYEYSMVIDGVNNPDQILFYQNTSTSSLDDPNDNPEVTLSTTLDPLTGTVGHAQVVAASGSNFGGDADYFVEWAVERSVAEAGGFDPSGPAQYYCGSSNNGVTIAADMTGATLSANFTDIITCGDLGCSMCGDSNVDGSEGCDDGNNTSGDGCSAGCLVELGDPCTSGNDCTSGYCNTNCGCDDDADCSGSEYCNLTSHACVVAACGNGALEGAEGCDDGGTTPGDGCDSSCLIELGELCSASAACASGFCDSADSTCACNEDGDCSGGDLCNTATAPNSCVAPGCGNGVLESGEACDDDNAVAGDGCGAACLVELTYACTGNAQCESGSCVSNKCVCDGDSDCGSGNLCNTGAAPPVCVAPGCGNGVLESGEGCDDSDVAPGDGCDAGCLIELTYACSTGPECASAFCDAADNTCACNDDADCSGSDVCLISAAPNACVATGCGNGVLESGEACDDGGTTAGDGCNAACLLELDQSCGADGDCASGDCDGAAFVCVCKLTTDCPVGQLCYLGANPPDCVASGCGNSVLESGEACDDGNASTGDGCDALCLLELGENCSSNSECGSGFCEAATGTCACNDQLDCPLGQVCDTHASANVCVLAGCQNFVLESGEACDDGNASTGDGCSATCKLELGESCFAGGDCDSGTCDGTAAICVCDQDGDCLTGQVCNTGAEPPICTAPGCGNSLLEPGEACDDGGTASGDGCDALCLKELDEPCAVGTECASGSCDGTALVCTCNDDGDCSGSDLCLLAPSPSACVAPGCGNGVQEPGEGCDDSGTSPGDGCSANCLLELNEDCTASGDCQSGLCDSAEAYCVCTVDSDCTTGQSCLLDGALPVCVTPGCGNGFREGSEGCDDDNTASGDGCSATCLAELGENCSQNADCESGSCEGTNQVCQCNDDADCGSLLCNSGPDPNACVNPGCGNSVLEANEGCDDGGTTAGDGCDVACLLELGESCSMDAECASGSCAQNECACDGDTDCPSGQLCRTAVTPPSCVSPGCGNGMVEAGESCDDAGQTAGDGCGAGCLLELGEDCSADADCESSFCADDGTCKCDGDADCPADFVCDVAPGTAECVAAGCGNSVTELGEACDDGNTDDNDGCSKNCLAELEEACDATSDCEVGECDASSICVCTTSTDCAAGEVCKPADPPVCVPEGCGNAVVETGEGCDDGNTNNADSCLNTCKKPVDELCNAAKECASGSCLAATGVCGCSKDGDCEAGEVCEDNVCVPSDCGNGAIEVRELCDDDNTKSGDGCSSSCAVEDGYECLGEPSECTLIDLTECVTNADCESTEYCTKRQTCEPRDPTVATGAYRCDWDQRGTPRSGGHGWLLLALVASLIGRRANGVRRR